MLLKNQQITKEITKEIYLEINGNENKTIHSLQDAVKAVLRGKFIAIQTYLNKQEKNSNKNLSSKAIRKIRTD